MEKLINYICNGQGRGLKILFLFILIMSVAKGIQFRIEADSFAPIAQAVAEQMLPIKVENGVVVEPVDVVRTASLSFGNQSYNLPLVLDTRYDTLDTTSLKPGAYLTRTTLYMVNNGDIRIKNLSGSFDLPKGDYTKDFAAMLNWTIIGVVLFSALVLFAVYYLLTIFYAWCSVAISYILSKKNFVTKQNLDINVRMRLSVCCLIMTNIICIILNYLTIPTYNIVFLIIVILLQGMIMIKLPRAEDE